MDKKFSKEYRRKTWIIAIYDSDDQGSWMGKIEATKKEVKIMKRIYELTAFCLSISLFVYTIVRCFFCNMNVMWMTFFQ